MEWLSVAHCYALTAITLKAVICVILKKMLEGKVPLKEVVGAKNQSTIFREAGSMTVFEDYCLNYLFDNPQKMEQHCRNNWKPAQYALKKIDSFESFYFYQNANPDKQFQWRAIVQWFDRELLEKLFVATEADPVDSHVLDNFGTDPFPFLVDHDDGRIQKLNDSTSWQHCMELCHNGVTNETVLKKIFEARKVHNELRIQFIQSFEADSAESSAARDLRKRICQSLKRSAPPAYAAIHKGTKINEWPLRDDELEMKKKSLPTAEDDDEMEV